MREAWTDIIVTSFREVVHRLGLVAPRVLAMLALVIFGWIVAAIARRFVVRVLRAADFDRRCTRWGVTASLARGGIRQSSSMLLGRLIFWAIFLVALLMGIEALEMPATTGLVAVAVGFFPHVVVASLVLLAGWLLANFMAQAVLIGAVNAQLPMAPLIAGSIRWLVLIFAAAAALTQLGIAREMVLLTFGIAFGGTVLALALAFGLGGKDLAREFLENRLRKQDEDTLTHV